MPHAAVGRALAVVAALAALGAPAQTMYKWVDEKGVTHFTDSPPPDDQKATKVTPKVTPPSGPVAPPSEDWKAKEADFRKRQIQREQKENAQAQDAAKRADQCDKARSRITFLQDGRIYRNNPDGTRNYMDEPQREAEIARMREIADRNCR